MSLSLLHWQSVFWFVVVYNVTLVVLISVLAMMHALRSYSVWLHSVWLHCSIPSVLKKFAHLPSYWKEPAGPHWSPQLTIIPTPPVRGTTWRVHRLSIELVSLISVPAMMHAVRSWTLWLHSGWLHHSIPSVLMKFAHWPPYTKALANRHWSPQSTIIPKFPIHGTTWREHRLSVYAWHYAIAIVIQYCMSLYSYLIAQSTV